MANIKGIELASEVYDLEDTSARDTATTASQTAKQAGQTATQASQTATQAKETAGDAAINANLARDEIGDISALETLDKSDLVSAINELAKKDTSKVFTCGYCKMQIPVGGSTNLSYIQMSTLIGKNLASFAVGQGVLLQGVAKQANATVGIPFSVFLQKTESGFDYYDEIDGTGISITRVFPNGTIFLANDIDSAVTLYLNVVGINASIINN